MKDVLKGVTIKIVSIIVVIILVGGGSYFAYKHFTGQVKNSMEHEVVNTVEVIKEKLESAAELNTGTYLCTDVITRTDSREFKDWKIPFTEKSFIVQYDGIVKAGIRDLSEAQITQDRETIIIKLPAVEITGVEIDNESFEKLDESNSIFNPISIEDLNDAQNDLKGKMKESATEKGILDIAKSNAETVLFEMLSSFNGEYEVKIEWSQE